MTKYIRDGSIVFFLLLSCYCNAQIDLSAGLHLGYPQMITGNSTMINAGEISSGLNAGIAYKPGELQFYPGLNFSYGNMWLPLQQAGVGIADLRFHTCNVMLRENFEVTLPRSQLVLHGGIGLSTLTEKGIPISDRNSNTMHASIDSTGNLSKVFPAMKIGAEYHHGESPGQAVYVVIGFDLQYLLLLPGRNDYFLTVSEPNASFHYQTSLTGNMICPEIYVAVHYKVRRKKVF